jgi:basic membrane protein A
MTKTFPILVFLAGCLTLGLPAEAAFRVGLVIDRGGAKDRGFNAAAIDGLDRARESFKIEGKVVEAADDRGHEPRLRELAKQGYDLVIALGAAREAALAKVAKEFPKTRFALVDGEVRAPNVRSILFKEQEGAYLVGAIAGAVAKTGKLGFLGGMDLPVIRRYEKGFLAGARQTFPKATLKTEFIGKGGKAWSDRPRAQALAEAQFDSGVETLFAVSGEANLGVFDAAQKKSKLAIGVSNQNWIKPGFILTSMRKRIDVGVLITCQDAMLGGFSAETKRYGLAEQGVDFVVDEHNRQLVSEAVLARVNALREKIAAGELAVP